MINDEVCVRLVKDQRMMTLASSEHDLDALFYRVNNTFIHRLRLSFSPGNLPFPGYLRASANDLQCRIGILSIHGSVEKIDDALVHFLGAHLKPKVYETWIVGQLREDYTMLFTHDALRGGLTDIVYKVAAQYFLPEHVKILFGFHKMSRSLALHRIFPNVRYCLSTIYLDVSPKKDCGFYSLSLGGWVSIRTFARAKLPS